MSESRFSKQITNKEAREDFGLKNLKNCYHLPVVRYVEVEDDVDGRDVETAACDVGRDLRRGEGRRASERVSE